MTALQKSIIAGSLVLTVGIGIYQGQQHLRLRGQLQTAEERHSHLADQVRRLTKERDAAVQTHKVLREENERLNRNAAESTRLRAEVDRLRTNVADDASAITRSESQADAFAASTVESWTGRVNELKGLVERVPEAKIPEFQFLAAQDWLDAAEQNNNRKALSALRSRAEQGFARRLQSALKEYLKGHDSQPPTDLVQLQPSFAALTDEALLRRWKIAPASEVPNIHIGEENWLVTQKASPLDEEYDMRLVIVPNASVFTCNDTVQRLNPAMEAFRAENNGKEQENPSQLVPYVTTPEQRAALDKLVQNEQRWQSLLPRH